MDKLRCGFHYQYPWDIRAVKEFVFSDVVTVGDVIEDAWLVVNDLFQDYGKIIEYDIGQRVPCIPLSLIHFIRTPRAVEHAKLILSEKESTDESKLYWVNPNAFKRRDNSVLRASERVFEDDDFVLLKNKKNDLDIQVSVQVNNESTLLNIIDEDSIVQSITIPNVAVNLIRNMLEEAFKYEIMKTERG